MAKNTRSAQANVAGNDINNTISGARNLQPGISAIGAAAQPKAENDYTAAKTAFGNAANTADTALGTTGTALNTTGQALDTTSGAKSTFGNMANTGGFSDADKTAYLNRATEGVGSAYSALGDQAKLNEMRTGASSGPAAIAEIARQGGQAQSQALNDAQVGLNSQINQNKLAGSAGLNQTAGTQGQIAGTQSGISGQQEGIGGLQGNIGNSQGNLYGQNEGVQQQAQNQLLQSVGLQGQAAGQAVQNAGNYSQTMLGNYIPNFSVGLPGGAKFGAQF